MNNFTSFSKINAINEAAKLVNTDVLSIDEIKAYLDKVGKKIPKQVADIVYLTLKYNLTSQKDIDDIRNANKSKLSTLGFNYNIPESELTELWKSLKDLKTNLRLLPQYQTASERSAFMAGKLLMQDITIDLDTSAGRNACAKQYMGMVHKILSEFVGKSKLNKSELMSAALAGFTEAMNTWRRSDKDDSKSVPFKTYAAYKVRWAIQHEISLYSGTITGSAYLRWKDGNAGFNGVSLDGFNFDSEDEFKQDRIAALGSDTMKDFDLKSEDDLMKDLYKFLDGKFKHRDVDIFYRYFGLNGYNKEKGKDIAKVFGVSAQMVTGIVQMIIRELKKDKKAMELLRDLQASYNESLMIDVMNLDKEMMIETILSDDMFILLEELTKWTNKDVYINTLEDVIDSFDNNDAKIIKKLLSGDFDQLDKMFKANKKLIISFLTAMYPTESFTKKTDVSLLEYMDELADLYKKYI